ncbi:hypothetical protein Rsub_13301, partial [Raphidocelis subcapitata]
MQLYWPKLRPGGIMAGHDFVTAETVSRWTNGTQDWSLCADGTTHPGAVRGAAEEMAAEKGVQMTVTGDGPPSFAFRDRATCAAGADSNRAALLAAAVDAAGVRTASVERWRGLDLTLLGRVYVAKQVLASMLTYHAT